MLLLSMKATTSHQHARWTRGHACECGLALREQWADISSSNVACSWVFEQLIAKQVLRLYGLMVACKLHGFRCISIARADLKVTIASELSLNPKPKP